MPTIDDNDAVSGGGRRTIPMVTLYDGYDSLVQPYLMASWLHYPYWRVVVPTNPVAAGKSVPVWQTASGQRDTKQSSCGAGPAKTLSLDDQRIVGGNNAIKNSWPGIVSFWFLFFLMIIAKFRKCERAAFFFYVSGGVEIEWPFPVWWIFDFER